MPGRYKFRNDNRIKAELANRALAAGQWEHHRATWCVRRMRPKNCPRYLVVHENRGLNPYIEDVARTTGNREVHGVCARWADVSGWLSGR